jgi:hypothetical protein
VNLVLCLQIFLHALLFSILHVFEVGSFDDFSLILCPWSVLVIIAVQVVLLCTVIRLAAHCAGEGGWDALPTEGVPTIETMEAQVGNRRVCLTARPACGDGVVTAHAVID